MRRSQVQRFLFAAAFVLAFTNLTRAELKLAHVFSDNMVLQRDLPIVISGTVEPGAKVEVTFGNQGAIGTANTEGKFQIPLPPLPANSTPQTLTVTAGGSKASVSNVLVGDVWLCSGQSNMAMTLHDSAGGDAFATQHGTNDQIRMLMVSKRFTDKVQPTHEGKWKVCTPEDAKTFSGVGFSFVASLKQDPALKDVPIGLIDSSFGATVIEAWIPQADLAGFDAKEIGNSMFGKATEHFNAMIAPLFPLPIKGVVWYQGESNSNRPDTYAKFFATLTQSWRKGFNQPQLPFIIVQLPAYNAKFSELFFTWVREQEAQAAAADKDVGLVVTYDTHNGSNLHPPEKIIIGERAALVASKLVYGENVTSSGPSFKSADIDGPTVHVTFNTAGDGLKTSDGSPTVRGFMLAGADGQYRYASGTLEGEDQVKLSAEGIVAPKTIRFAWEAVPKANLVGGTSGLPALPFRTDDFAPTDVELVSSPPPRTVKNTAYEATVDWFGRLTSLGIFGQQFLSNDLGLDGGSSIPTFFGPRPLITATEISPQEITFSDPEVKLTYKFGLDTIELTLQNSSKTEVSFQLALAPAVEAGEGNNPELKRGDAKLKTTGFDKIEKQPNGKTFLKLSVPAENSRTMKLTATK